MQFPHWAGFSGGAEEQRSDLFTRSVLAGVLLDVAQALALQPDARPQVQAALRSAARLEAERLASARLPGLGGGWSYFPGLPELPPDLDSLAAAVSLFARIAPEHMALAEGPLRLALTERDRAGGCRTWLLAADDPPAARQCMQRAISLYWGDSVDVDVNARFARALRLAGRPRHEVEPSLQFVRSHQQADGGWPRTWYWSPLSVTELCADLPGVDRAAALAHSAALQRSDGGWGVDESDPLDTALGTWLLAGSHPGAAARGAAWLRDNLGRNGSWRRSTWIRMPVGRAQGQTRHLARYGCPTLNNALALRALLHAAPRA